MSEFEKGLDNMLVYNPDFYEFINDKQKFINKYEPKPLVEVPQIVADWIELIKQRNRNVLTLLDSDDMPDDVYDWLFIKEDDENINLILLAWIDGYTVEKAKLYALEFPKQLNTFVAYTVKNQDNEVIISGYTSIKKGAKRFTEKEIKDIDPRYLAFAVKVDEVEG